VPLAQAKSTITDALAALPSNYRTGREQNHKQAYAEVVISTLPNTAGIRCIAATWRTKTRLEPSVLYWSARRRHGGAYKIHMVRAKQASEQNEVTRLHAKLTPWPRNIQPAFLASRFAADRPSTPSQDTDVISIGRNPSRTNPVLCTAPRFSKTKLFETSYLNSGRPAIGLDRLGNQNAR